MSTLKGFIHTVCFFCTAANGFPFSLCFLSFRLRQTAAVSLSLHQCDLKVTGLRFTPGICSESLSSVYLRLRRFELPSGARRNTTPRALSHGQSPCKWRKCDIKRRGNMMPAVLTSKRQSLEVDSGVAWFLVWWS